jgi:hypothetical protein
MNQKKAKAIRRAMRVELAKNTPQRWIAHPKTYTAAFTGQKAVRYSFQYINEGGKKLVAIAKRIYRAAGILPRVVAREAKP